MSRTTILSIALVLAVASLAQAQKGKGGRPVESRTPPTVTPHGATPATRAVPAVPGGKGKRATPAVRAVPATPASQISRESKAEEKSEHRGFRDARHQSERLLRHVRLTPDQRKQVKVIRKNYDKQYKTLEKQERSTDKAGTSDAAILQQLATLRARESAELRGVLTAAQQAEFDRNAAMPGKH